MNDILMRIGAVLLAAEGLAAAVRHTQMFQQNSYYLRRYFGWLKTAFHGRSFAACFLFLLSAVSIVFGCGYGVTTAGVLGLVRFAVAKGDHKKSIKKLVWTARVKRLYAVQILLVGGGLTVGEVWGGYGYLPTALLSFATPLVILLSGLIMAPIEWRVRLHFIHDAERILKNHRRLTVIGVTGSYGKTSTKFILARILSERFNVVATPESFNTPMGVVRTVREKLTAPTEIFIAEMGAKRKGDIKEICNICHPTVGIVTSVGPQHLDTFGSIETVLTTKLELGDAVRQNGGRLYLNSDNELLAGKAASYEAVCFGENEKAAVRAENIRYGSEGLTFDIVKADLRFTVHTALLGRHAAANITAAAAIALDLGETPEEIALAVSALQPVEHRLQMRPYYAGSLLLDDAYNANPSGSMNAVEVLGSFEGRTKIIVTPGLVELGEQEYECNKALGKAAAGVCDYIILVGQKRSVPLLDGVREAGFDESRLFVVDRFADAAAKLVTLCDDKTVVLLENDLPDNYAG